MRRQEEEDMDRKKWSCSIGAISLSILLILALGCISQKDEAISIAKQLPEFKDQNASFEEKNNTWIVKTENFTVFIDPKTKQVIKTYKISEEQAKKIALSKWLRDRVMIPENKPVAIAEDKEDHWLVTIQIIDMFTGEIITKNAGQYKVNKTTGEGF